MASYRDEAIRSIKGFVDFSGKKAIIAGGGGGKLIGYADAAREIVAVDRDRLAIDDLLAAIERTNRGGQFVVINEKFEDVELEGDMVVFEYSLHEFDDIEAGLRHAFELAPAVYVVEHSSDSEWIRLAGEDAHVKNEEEIIGKFEIKRQLSFSSHIDFARFDDLESVFGAGADRTAGELLGKYRGKDNIRIEMKSRMLELGK